MGVRDHCNRYLYNIAVLLFEMLEYIIFYVAAHNFRHCNTYFFNVVVYVFSMLHYIFL